MNKGTKISEEEFLSILRENAGLFARTARAIEKQFGIKYSRQAVRDRAYNHLEELKDIKEENLDIAEEGLYTLMRSRNERIRLDSTKLYLKTQGKSRGYIERVENVVSVTEELTPKQRAKEIERLEQNLKGK